MDSKTLRSLDKLEFTIHLFSKILEHPFIESFSKISVTLSETKDEEFT